MKANIQFNGQSACLLRDLAASLGIFIQRGVGTGTTGNIKELMEDIADAYETAPDKTRDLVQRINQISRNKAKQEIDEMIKRDRAIIIN